MTVADRRRGQVRGRLEPGGGEELAQRVEHEQRLALVGGSLLRGFDDVVGCGGDLHVGRGAYRVDWNAWERH